MSSVCYLDLDVTGKALLGSSFGIVENPAQSVNRIDRLADWIGYLGMGTIRRGPKHCPNFGPQEGFIQNKFRSEMGWWGKNLRGERGWVKIGSGWLAVIIM